MSITRHLVAALSLLALHASDPLLAASALERDEMQIATPLSEPIITFDEAIEEEPSEAAEAVINNSYHSQVNYPEATESSSLKQGVRFGEINGKRVRMRVASQLDAPVIQELEKGMVVEITGETGDFYAVRPPFAMKAYVFRTYILDGKIEGNKVNVRLKPTPEAPILTQLCQGTPIEGLVSSQNSKWMEINLPASVRFYISRDYVTLIERNRYAQLALEQAKKSSKVVTAAPLVVVAAPPVLASPIVQSTNHALAINTHLPPARQELTRWQIQEETLEKEWLQANPAAQKSDYQQEELQSAFSLQGRIEPYEAPDFAPGDYLLCQGDRILAILYSAQVDLDSYVGKQVSLRAVARDNNNFAYSTFAVVEIEAAGQ